MGQAVQDLEPVAPKVLAGHILLTRAATPGRVTELSLVKTKVRTLEEEVRVAGVVLPAARISVGEVVEGPSRTEK